MPKYTDTGKTGEIGTDILSLLVKRELSWVFREQAKSDLGIDGQIEVVNEDKEGSGRLIAVQLKTGQSYLKHETEEGFQYYGNNSHLKYWLNHSLPVIVVLCDDRIDVCYWVEVSRSNVKKTASGWNVLVPKSQTISSAQINNLKAIAGAPAHHDIVELALFKFMGDKHHAHSATGRLDICPLIDEPRDFHGFSYLGRFEVTNELVFISHYYDIYKDFDESIIYRDLELRKYNTESWALSEKTHKLMLFIISEDKENLKSYKKIVEDVGPLENVEIYRLLYKYDPLGVVSASRFYDLTELDEGNNEIYLY
ncbi:MAG TPA: DUF4365 domain-containing protein [Kangiella sp.]